MIIFRGTLILISALFLTACNHLPYVDNPEIHHTYTAVVTENTTSSDRTCRVVKEAEVIPGTKLARMVVQRVTDSAEWGVIVPADSHYPKDSLVRVAIYHYQGTDTTDAILFTIKN